MIRTSNSGEGIDGDHLAAVTVKMALLKMVPEHHADEWSRLQPLATAGDRSCVDRVAVIPADAAAADAADDVE